MIELTGSEYSYDKWIRAAKSLAKQYDTVIKYVTIGKSHDNRDIVLLKLGVGQKHMVCCAGVHARETVNPVVLLKIAEFYAELYSNYRKQKKNFKNLLGSTDANMRMEYEQLLFGACIFELLKTFTILMVPLLNPDGYMIALQGFEALREPGLREKCESMQISSAEWKANARGVDINRNFPSLLWKEKWKTDIPASENETRALIQLFNEYKTIGFLDFHSRGRAIYYHRSVMPESYNIRQLEIARRLREITNYDLVPPEEEMEADDSGGNTVHYYSEHFYKPALTIETVEEEAVFPLREQYRETVFEELKLIISGFGSMIV